MILFTVTLIAYIFNTVFNLLALFKAKNKKQTIKSDTTDTPLYILMIVNFLLVPDIMFNVTITIINLVNILLDTFRFIRNPLNNKSLLINVTINISYILLSFLLLGVCIQKSVKNVPLAAIFFCPNRTFNSCDNYQYNGLRFVCIFVDNMFTIKSKYDILKIVNTAKKKRRTK